MNVLSGIGSALLLCMWARAAEKDKDFMVDDKFLEFTAYDKCFMAGCGFLTVILIMNLPIAAAFFAANSLPYLTVSALTDKKTKLVYNMPFYVFLLLAVIIESVVYGKIHVSIVVIFLFAEMLAGLKLFGKGDRAMTVICGVICYFYNPAATVFEALLANCIMVLVAEIIFYVRAIKERNLDGPFRLKESRPLGPDLCIGTFIVLIKVVFV